MLKRYRGPRGTVVKLRHESKILKDNPLKDPHVREVGVYLPHGYDDHPKRRYPMLLDMVGFTGSGHSHLNWKPFDENVPEKLDRLIHAKKMGPVIVVFPDCFTSLGGNQYINSSALGNYEDYLVEEIIPLIEANFRTQKGRLNRACFGKSSGGYGAIIHGLRRPDVWGAVACHSGDMYFDYCYRMDFPRMLNTLAKHGRSVKRFLNYFRKVKKPSPDDCLSIMWIAMAAFYDPDPKEPLGFHMPLDLYTGELDERRWRRWLKHDPVHLVDKNYKNLKKLKLVYIDCGNIDQFHLHYGARLLVKKLKKYKVKHFYEEFDDNHSSVDYRMDKSLPMLYRALTGK
ncbi:esterase family protein [Acidobacteria bacterium AH-259-D05]|nr:esterase family protein [Acidobacteria bacterium AH-259-D05]